MPAGMNFALSRLLIGTSPDALLPILEMLAIVGESAAIPNVEALLKQRKGPEVQRAAEHTLQVLLERKAALTAKQTLLRQSSKPDSPQGELLRPADGESDADPSELLRPTEE